MTFAPESERLSLFSALRPNTGQNVSRAIVTTYSLDLIAMLGLVLALGGDDQADLEASPLGLIKAFDNMRGRLTVLHQLSRISIPTAHRSILPLLDAMLYAVPADERLGSWHPKIALVRYNGADGVQWRLWIGSRNLTGSTDLEAGLLLISSDTRKATRVEGLDELVSGMLSIADMPRKHIAELKKAKWLSPEGMQVERILSRSPGRITKFIDGPLLDGADTALCVSPFLDKKWLEIVRRTKVDQINLLTTSAAAKSTSDADGLTIRILSAPEPRAEVDMASQLQEADADFATNASLGLHAKLLALCKGKRAVLMLGSANLTKRGLDGPNAEAVAVVAMRDVAITDSLRKLINSGLPLDAVEKPEVDSAKENAERDLDALVSRFSLAQFGLSYCAEGVDLIIDDLDRSVLESADFEASCFLRDYWIAIDENAGSLRLSDDPPPMEENTALVNFRARSQSDPEIQRSWVQRVPITGFDVAKRDDALMASYIGAARFRLWLASLLDGADHSAGQSWPDGFKAKQPVKRGIQLGSTFTLESMLTAWARDPSGFEARMSKVMRMMGSFEEAFGRIQDPIERQAATNDLEEIRPFLTSIIKAMKGRT